MDLTLEQIARTAGGRSLGAAATARGFAFDSRTLVSGEGFVAIRAERDGHDFVADAAARGAALAVVDHELPGIELPQVVVDDTVRALQALAAAARTQLEGVPVVGVTGSAGKTSTKDLTAAALGARFAVQANAASFNNEIGLPVTILGTPPGTEALVLEMGARFEGNIAELCAIARPTIGVVTNIGLAHAEHLGGPDGVARVKGELLEALPAGGLAVISADGEHTAVLRARTGARVLTTGFAADADVQVSDVRVDGELRATFALRSPWGTAPDVTLASRGAYQVANAAQAATVALHLGVPLDAVVDALGRAATSAWRMELTPTSDGIVVVNDAYNASPTSMLAALESFSRLAVTGRRIAVLGEMRELGAIAPAEHARVGEQVGRAGVGVLVTVGGGTDELGSAAAATGVEVHHVDDTDAAVRKVRSVAAPGDAVLVKASRLVGLERVADALLQPQERAS
jgi:UDP-N-acetylmuramoyl-tripeptide--D-alanyl-D-alanine ligase